MTAAPVSHAPQEPYATFGISTPEAWDFTRKWLRGYRRQLKLTQQDVADRMQSSKDVVSNLETGHSDPRISTLMRYVRALGLRAHFDAIHGDQFTTLGGDDAEE